MSPQTFVRTYRAAAVAVSHATGVLAGVLLAQWAVETGWGKSDLAVNHHNLAGIRFYNHLGTVNVRGFAGYAYVMPNGKKDGHTAFVTDCIRILKLPYYRRVRVAKGPLAQISELGKSPWAAGHYGSPPGASVLAAYRRLVAFL